LQKVGCFCEAYTFRLDSRQEGECNLWGTFFTQDFHNYTQWKYGFKSKLYLQQNAVPSILYPTGERKTGNKARILDTQAATASLQGSPTIHFLPTVFVGLQPFGQIPVLDLIQEILFFAFTLFLFRRGKLLLSKTQTNRL